MLLFSPAIVLRIFAAAAMAAVLLIVYLVTFLPEETDTTTVVATDAILILISAIFALLWVVFSGVVNPFLKSHWSSKAGLIFFEVLLVRSRWLVFTAMCIGFYPVNMVVTDPQSRTAGFFTIQYSLLSGALSISFTIALVRSIFGQMGPGLQVLLSELEIAGKWRKPLRFAIGAGYLFLIASCVCWARVVYFADEGLRSAAVALFGLAILPMLVLVPPICVWGHKHFFGLIWPQLGDYKEDPNHPVILWLNASRYAS